MNKKYTFAFFGTPDIAVTALKELAKKGMVPELIITAPDRKQGRGLRLLPSPVKKYAEEEKIPYLTPEKIKDIREELEKTSWDFFLVFAYGKILPEWLLTLPAHGTLNIHPSLLPAYRGPSPLEGSLLSDDTETGVSLMVLDKEVDHGPIIAQKKIVLKKEMTKDILGHTLGALGVTLLLETIDDYTKKILIPKEQDHTSATFTKKIEKSDGELFNHESDWQKWKKYRAYKGSPGTYFFTERNGEKIRVKITEAQFKDDIFTITKVIPENGKEIPFSLL